MLFECIFFFVFFPFFKALSIDTLLLTMIIILALGPTTIGTLMAIQLPELNTMLARRIKEVLNLD